MTTTPEELYRAYRAGKKVRFTFHKKDMSVRNLIALRDAEAKEMEAAIVGGTVFKNPDVVRVVEITDDGTHQWRSVTLSKVFDGEIF